MWRAADLLFPLPTPAARRFFSIYPAKRLCQTGRMRILLGLALLFAIGCAPSAGGSGTGDGKAAGASGSTAAVLPTTSGWVTDLVDVDGNAFRPAEHPELQALVMVFVLQDCPIANSYHPRLNELTDTFADRGVKFFVIETDPAIDVAAARKHREEYAMRPAVVVDAEHRWVKHTGATKTPEAAVFLPDGKLVYRGRIDDRYAGLGKKRTEATVHDLQNTLEAVLAGRSVPNAMTDAVGCYIPELPAPVEKDK
jgi:hypothetical protein